VSRLIWKPSGVLKRVYIDRKAAADGKPAWIVRTELDTGVVDITHCVHVELNGRVYTAGDKAHPLTPEGPAYWLETVGEVDCIVEG
jgi:hypothetical protein